MAPQSNLVKYSDETLVRVISFVRDNPCLWQKSNKNYKNNAMKSSAYKKLDGDLALTRDKTGKLSSTLTNIWNFK